MAALYSCTIEDGQDMPDFYLPEYIFPELSPSLGRNDFPQPERNLISKEGLELGKMLFYDPKLSANGQVSCATCHQPDLAFSDGKVLTDSGVSGKPLHRHSPVLFNLAWYEGWFWDGGAKNLESLMFAPLTHADEMGMDLPDMLNYVNAHGQYPRMFRDVFGELPVLNAHVSRALAQFTRSLISQNSRYDQWYREEAVLFQEELEGYRVYQKHCSSCHREGLFTDLEYHNNGLDNEYPDLPELEGLYFGRFRISFDPKDLGAYKTPSLRNVMLTAPYMHDGRFQDMMEVLDHYENGIQKNENLPDILEKGIPLTAEEKENLIAFLHTLTDDEFIQNTDYRP